MSSATSLTPTSQMRDISSANAPVHVSIEIPLYLRISSSASSYISTVISGGIPALAGGDLDDKVDQRAEPVRWSKPAPL